MDDIGMMEWHWNDNLMTKWIRNDWRKLEWWNYIGMMGWNWNDGMTEEWWYKARMG